MFSLAVMQGFFYAQKKNQKKIKKSVKKFCSYRKVLYICVTTKRNDNNFKT